AARVDQLLKRHARPVGWDPAALSSGEHKQVLRDADEVVDLAGGALERQMQVVEAEPVRQGRVDLGLQDRERRTQLVTGVVDEPALPLERRLEPIERE